MLAVVLIFAERKGEDWSGKNRKRGVALWGLEKKLIGSAIWLM